MNGSSSNFSHMLDPRANRNRNLMVPFHRLQFQQQQQQQQEDEISKSLQMFAMLTAYKNNIDSYGLGSSLNTSDAVMRDFACNGYVADESSVHRQLGMMHLTNPYTNRMSLLTATLSPINGGNVNNPTGNNEKKTNIANSAAAILNQQGLGLQNHINFNIINGFWGISPTDMHRHTNAVDMTAAAAAVNVDSNQKKLARSRYNGGKNEKYTSAKHCVFCENNNEPQEVVKSHAVRDSLGRVLCPKLRTYICPICRASGDFAHTVKYCPQRPIVTMEDAVNAEALRLNKAFQATNLNLNIK